MPTDTQVAIFRLVRGKRSFLISGHERPDGDLCGSAIALRTMLAALGKSARVVLPEAPPERYMALDGAGQLEVFDGEELEADAIFVLDAAAPERLGSVADALPPNAPVINIDHHLSNNGFGEISWVAPEASSVGEMLYELAREGGWPMPQEACEGLYAAIITDTGRFCHSNTSASALRSAAELVELGVSAHAMARKLYRSRSQREIRLEERALSRLNISGDGRLATISLYSSDFRELGAVHTDAQDFAELSVSVAGVELGAFLYELEAGRRTKLSLRSAGSLDASRLASRFGGGGHAAAAGCTMDMGLDEALELFEEVGAEALKAQDRR